MRAKERTTIGWLLLLLALPFWASCKGDSTTTTSSNDYCYIKSVTLGTVKRHTNTVNTSFSAAEYEMTVNHRDLTIENRDSLPYGSLLSRVIATIAFDGSTLTYREKGSSAGWTAYNSTDSLDLTKPLELYLTSNDNQNHRIYTLKVNVHQQEGDSLYWSKCKDDGAFAGMTDMKATTMDDELLVLGKKGTDFVLLQHSIAEPQGAWLESTISGLPATTDLQTLCKYSIVFYLSTTDGEIYTSTDAKEWQQEGSRHTAALTLIGKTANYYYAFSEGKMLRSTDATTWEEDKLDTDASVLPTSGIRALATDQANGNNRIVMVGQNDNLSNAVVWSKMWNDSEKEEDAQWIYYTLSDDNKIPCPRLAHLNLLPYDGKCIALGGAALDGSHKALDVMYVSQDYGITWRPDAQHRLPADLKGTEDCITCTVDENNFIWIITNTQVWRGRLNRLGFAQQ